jgi:hypothetical protein
MKKVHVIGGGTFSHIRTHLALSAPAFGHTAKKLTEYAKSKFSAMNVYLHLTDMAGGDEHLQTNEDVRLLIERLKEDNDTKVIFFNPALVDYDGSVIGEETATSPISLTGRKTKNGKYEERLQTSNGKQQVLIEPSKKIVPFIRQGRKDIFLVAFKATAGASIKEQYKAGLKLLKEGSCNLVLANDVITKNNMIITPEEAKYSITTDRNFALMTLVDMAFKRSQLSFTRSTVVAGDLVPWNSPEVYPALRTVVDFCIKEGAYKPFNGATVGHFACKLSDTEFLTSVRKSNFNDLDKNGLVRIKTDGPDTVIAYGAKPSVGGQSQRIIFSEHMDKEYDCIVHFHCPLKALSQVPVVSQYEYECGSHECGKNTSKGLKRFDEYELSAVMLDNHGPNIVFNHNIDPNKVVEFIKRNFDLQDKTGGTF